MALPIVLLPGSLCDERLFTGLDLGDHDSVVADLTLDDSLGGMARRVLDTAPERFIAIGLSMGAIVAAELARLAPERVVGLGLLATNLMPIDPAQVRRREHWASDARSGLFPAIVESMIPALVADPAAHGQAVVDMALTVGADGFLRQNHALLHRTRDRRADLAQYPGPVFVGYGVADAVCPPALHAELVVHRPDAELVAFDEAGHLVALEQPAALARALREWVGSVQHQPTMEGYSQ